MNSSLPVLAGALLLAAAPAHAAKLFAVDASYNAGADSISVEDGSLPDLIDNLVKSDGPLSVLAGQTTVTASLTYFALPNALTIELDRTDPQLIQVRFTSPLTGLDETFTATNEDDLQEQLTEWFYLDGSAEAGQLLQELVKRSAAVITDGSPGATTAQMADVTFRQFGFYPDSDRSLDMRGSTSGAHIGLQLDSRSSTVESPVGDLRGTATRATIPVWFHFSKRVSLVGNGRVDLIDIEDTEFYGVGTDVGIALRPVVRTGEDRFGWQITPFLGGYGIASADGVTGAFVSQYGANNRLEFRVFERSLVSFVSQYTSFKNLSVNIGDVELSTPIDQNILKNGLMFEFPLFSLESLYANLSLVDTRFLEEAAIDGYQTYGGGLAWKLNTFSVQTNLGYDHTDAYTAWNLNLSAVWDL